MKHVIKESFLPKEWKGSPSIGTVEFFCKNCGTELCWDFEYAFTTQWLDLKNKLSDRELYKKVASSYGDEKRIREINKEIKHIKGEMKRCEVINESEHQAKIACKKIVDQSVCPICGALLCKERGYFMPSTSLDREAYSWIIDHYDDIIDGSYIDEKEIKEKNIRIRQEYDKTQGKEMVACFVQNSETPCELIPAGADEIKNDTEALKTYLLHLIQLENNIYSLKGQLAELYCRRLTNDRSVIYGKNAPVALINEEIESLKEKYEKSKKQVEIAKQNKPKVSIKKPQKPQEPVLKKPGLFNKKRVMSENEELISQYKRDMTVYQEKLQQYENKKVCIKEEHKEVVDKALKKSEKAKASYEKAKSSQKERIKLAQDKLIPANAISEMLNLEIFKVEELLKNTIAARNELYAYDIIFAKYRNIVALSSFYEYLVSGRCSLLAGHDGAYNIYENEIQMNRVVDRLDTVISSLDEIKHNQYLIYKSLQSIDASLCSLNSTMDKALTSIQGIEKHATSINEYMVHISKNSDVIAHNTAVTAYYSKINAELTNALGYMVAFK